MERIGILGGTFDPIHVGHLIAAAAAHERLELDRLLLVPARIPPHKRSREISDPEVRLEMARAAVEGDPRFEVDDLELRREGPSYTVDTLRALRGRHADAELILLFGADGVPDLHTWKEIAEIARLARLVSLDRDVERGGDAPVEVERLDTPRVDVSATELRERARTGRSLRYFVPEGVRRIIEREGLYGG